MKTTDSLGRATFHNIERQQNIRPTAREIRWLKHIELHGPQASTYLHALTEDTHRCKDTALRQMQKLRAGGYLFLPKQQRQTEHADFNPYIYDLAPRGKEYLKDVGLAEPTVRPTGHWWHGYMTSCITSSIEIAATKEGTRYIPAHEILARNGANLRIPIGNSKLIPDQLFALDYGGSYRAFMLEADRSTEPIQSAAARKSLKRSIDQYTHVIENGLHKRHYGLKANVLVLWVFASKKRQQQMLELTASIPVSIQRQLLSQTCLLTMISRSPWEQMLQTAWESGASEVFTIGQVA